MTTPRNEANRLRVIIETLAYAQPDMKLSDAVPAIWEIEKRTAKLELEQHASLDGRSSIPLLLDYSSRTIAAWIDTQPKIKDFILDLKKIDAIKEVRRLTGASLKESKDGVEAWGRGVHLL